MAKNTWFNCGYNSIYYWLGPLSMGFFRVFIPMGEWSLPWIPRWSVSHCRNQKQRLGCVVWMIFDPFSAFVLIVYKDQKISPIRISWFIFGCAVTGWFFHGWKSIPWDSSNRIFLRRSLIDCVNPVDQQKTRLVWLELLKIKHLQENFWPFTFKTL